MASKWLFKHLTNPGNHKKRDFSIFWKGFCYLLKKDRQEHMYEAYAFTELKLVVRNGLLDCLKPQIRSFQ